MNVQLDANTCTGYTMPFIGTTYAIVGEVTGQNTLGQEGQPSVTQMTTVGVTQDDGLVVQVITSTVFAVPTEVQSTVGDDAASSASVLPTGNVSHLICYFIALVSVIIEI
ncbi:hypothetical protein SARC_10693 [Sphaeroforma arctica JP610]|uniref:Uncharacterized protein n=1 Tax=Sphaeroforma arctica JP610 TaxID=667725 RepID=A0A0L0FLC4_9EUKA|nr:hypothetical protein SARC_10693 [Sphaeroforma arctica JP610]KNC76828.1 hypothetical protein SARC_10693 [Sphaeroforma arctica JP610]|eukprot:XP_014150730.1 hypothetical protein SARC_10693 [Sphaeroforma arctica JP610]